MILVDVHAHMDYPPMSDKIEEVISRAKEKNVKIIISNGTSPESNRKILELSKKYDIIKVAMGFYPTKIQISEESEIDDELSFIENEFKKGKVIAIGEVGLDKKFSPEDDQPELSEDEKKAFFEKQVIGFKKIIELAEKTGLPLIVHSRKAELEAIEMLEKSSVKHIIMHCFTGKKKLVKRIRDNGWTFSTPVTLLKLQQFQELVSETPLNQLLLETDSPFLGPTVGVPNEPANVSLTLAKIAEIKGLTIEETADNLFMNYQKIFL